MDAQTEQALKHATDGAIALGGISWFWWGQMLGTLGYVLTFIGGLVLLALRIMIAWHEWKTRKAVK